MPNADDTNLWTRSRNALTGRPAAPPDAIKGPARRSVGAQLLGWWLLTASVGLVSCQSLFVL